MALKHLSLFHVTPGFQPRRPSGCHTSEVQMLILARHLSFKFFFEAESFAICLWACFLHILRSCQDPAGEVLVTDHLSHLPLTLLSDSPVPSTHVVIPSSLFCGKASVDGCLVSGACKRITFLLRCVAFN